MALLSSLSPGDIFLLNENGVPAEFYVGVHDYQSDLNGTGRTLCVRKDVCTERIAWTSMATFFSGTYLPTLDPAIQSAVGTTKFYVNAGSGAIGTITEERAIFALSGTELGFSSSSLTVEGTALPVAEQIRVAGPDGYVPQFTRSPDTDGMRNVFAVTAAGGLQSIRESAQGYARPAFTLPATTEVSVPIPAPAITAPPNVSWGVPATATCTTVEDPNGGTVSYSWGLSYDGTSWQTLSGSSNSCTYTAFGDHYLRVQAVSTTGDSSDYAQSALVQVSSWGPQIIYGRGIGKIREESIVVNVNESFTLEYSNRYYNCTNTDPIVVTVPADLGDVGFEAYFFQSGAGSVTFAPAETVTINSVDGKLAIGKQYGLAALKLVGENTWNLQGLLG